MIDTIWWYKNIRHTATWNYEKYLFDAIIEIEHFEWYMENLKKMYVKWKFVEYMFRRKIIQQIVWIQNIACLIILPGAGMGLGSNVT